MPGPSLHLWRPTRRLPDGLKGPTGLQSAARSLQPDNFPSNIFLHLLIQGFPHALSWIWTIYDIVWYVVLGAIAGAMNRK